jgi:uncharacterized protein YegL
LAGINRERRIFRHQPPPRGGFVKDATQIVIVLDRSGSMEVVREATIESFNQFIINEKAKPGEARVYFVQFNTQYQVLFDKPIADAPTLSYLSYQPDGGTALYDAVGHTIDAIGQRLSAMRESERPSKVIFVVLTDGEENSSRRYSQMMIAERIEHQRNKYGWEFVFLGANQDAVMTARGLAIPARAAMSYRASPEGVFGSIQAVESFMDDYRAGGQAAFSEAHRAAAMGGIVDPDAEGESENKKSPLFSWLRRTGKSAAHSGQS